MIWFETIKSAQLTLTALSRFAKYWYGFLWCLEFRYRLHGTTTLIKLLKIAPCTLTNSVIVEAWSPTAATSKVIPDLTEILLNVDSSFSVSFDERWSTNRSSSIMPARGAVWSVKLIVKPRKYRDFIHLASCPPPKPHIKSGYVYYANAK